MFSKTRKQKNSNSISYTLFFTQNTQKKEETKQIPCDKKASHEDKGLNCKYGEEKWKVPGSPGVGILLE